MPKNKAKGELNMSWSSDLVDKQTTESENGNMETEIWPGHINPDELTDKQRNVLETALKNPTVTAEWIEEECNVSNGYVSRVLRDKVPEWYENTFKSDVAKKRTAWASDDSKTESESEGMDTTEDTTETAQTDVQAVIEAMKETAQYGETISALEVVEGYL